MITTQNTLNAYNDIMSGAGWCTADYIINFMDELSNFEQFQLMLKLAEEDLLVDEMKMTDDDGDTEDIDEISLEAKYSVKGVERDYFEYFELVSI